MKTPFTKMHGLGNDFAVFDAREKPLFFEPGQIRLLADRRRGIGFDQMVVLEPCADADVDLFMRIYNADGGEVGACGNATRCVGKLIKKQNIKVKTLTSVLNIFFGGDEVTVDMGPPRLAWQEIPLVEEMDTLTLPLNAGVLVNPTAVNVGNPHAVFFVPDAESVNLSVLGPGLEHHFLFPERVNVGVAEVVSRQDLRLRVWERGAGITQACGTGACAAVVAAVRRGLTERRVTVALDGGTLDIEWRETDGHVLMTGGATHVYDGEVTL